MKSLFRTALLGSVAAIAFSQAATAQLGGVMRPFDFVGYIEQFTLDDPTNPLSGAKIRLNGVEVTVPKNLIVQMPGRYLTPFDIFCLNPDPLGNPAGPQDGNTCTTAPAESGLALKDPHPPIAAFEAQIIGNNVGGEHIAGLVYIQKELLSAGTGYVKYIDYDKAEMIVGKSLTDPVDLTKDARVRINDPAGRHAKVQPDAAYDQRFSIDVDNATVHAETGYPLCIPRSAGDDPLCPSKNRPLLGPGNPLTRFVMDTRPIVVPAVIGGPDIVACPACDQTQQAPFVVGDYIAYSGTLVKDPTPPAVFAPDGSIASPYFISSWQVTAPGLGIYTAPGRNPAYLWQEVSLLGTFGPDLGIPQERQDRLKIEGFTTDPTRLVEIYAIDVDGAGTDSLRLIARTATRASRLGQYRLIIPKTSGALLDPDTGVTKGAVRELMTRVARGLPLIGQPVPEGPLFANGFVAGQYVAPMTEFLFPENNLPGDRLVPANFECLQFLVQGSGPLVTNGRAAGPYVGALDPFPGEGKVAPAVVSCGL